jgi:hypothetical protein
MWESNSELIIIDENRRFELRGMAPRFFFMAMEFVFSISRSNKSARNDHSTFQWTSTEDRLLRSLAPALISTAPPASPLKIKADQAELAGTLN